MIGISRLVKNKKSFSDKLRYGKNPFEFEQNGLFRPVIVFNLTSICNLSCKHCYYSAKLTPDPDELSTTELKNIIDDLALLQIPTILLSGGEPLMRKDIFDISKYITSKKIEVGLSTNGTLIKEHNIHKIKDAGINYVGISLDGFEKTHDMFRGKKGAFKMAEEAISVCIQNNIIVSVRLTLTKYNKDELSDLLDWAEEKKINRFCIYHLIGTGRGKSISDSALSPSETRAVMEMIYQKSKYLNYDILTVNAPFDGLFLTLKKLQEGDENSARSIIRALENQGGDGTARRIAVISHNGFVYLSQFLLDIPVGDVRKQNFSKIWNDPKNQLLNYLRNVRDNLQGKCGTCPLRYICGGFRPRALLYTGKLNGEDPLCYLDEKEKFLLSSYLN